MWFHDFEQDQRLRKVSRFFTGGMRFGDLEQGTPSISGQVMQIRARDASSECGTSNNLLHMLDKLQFRSVDFTSV